MELRLTDGLELHLLDCSQEYNPETGEKALICVLSKEYTFNEISAELNKSEIAEILSVFEDKEGDCRDMIFQSKEYTNVASVSNDIKTGMITVKFNNQKR